jgi:Na+/H+-dicarboxylate symporter
LARTVGGRYITFFSLVALVLGLALGIVLHGSRATWVPPLANALNVVGTVWIRVLQFTVVPLVVTQAFAAVMRTERLGTLGGKTLALFVSMLTVGALFTLLVSPPLLALYSVDAATVTALRDAITVPQTVRDGLGSETDLGDWLWGFVPTNAGRIFRGANFLLVLVSVIVVALLVKRFAGGRREAIQRSANRVADVALQLVGWVLLATPLGVLAVTFGLALSAGGSAVGLMTYYIVVVSGLLLVFTALLYPLTALVAGIPLRRFAQAVAPAQLVAVSTRSSLASLPALVEGGKERGLPVAATGFVLPLAVSTFKQSMSITHPFMLLFIAHMFGMQLGIQSILVFVGTIFLISFATLGIPGGNPGVSTLPAFVAAGVPVEGVLILDSLDTIPDIFKTVINVTAAMSAAAIATRAPASVAES